MLKCKVKSNTLHHRIPWFSQCDLLQWFSTSMWTTGSIIKKYILILIKSNFEKKVSPLSNFILIEENGIRIMVNCIHTKYSLKQYELYGSVLFQTQREYMFVQEPHKKLVHLKLFICIFTKTH